MIIWSKCPENSALRSKGAPLQNCDCTRAEWKRFWNPYNFVSRTLSERCPYSCFVVYGQSTFPPFRQVNKQTFQYWSHNNPWELHQRPLHSPKVTVWCAILKFGVWGLYFFLKRTMLL
jgi:hypothetical protein